MAKVGSASKRLSTMADPRFAQVSVSPAQHDSVDSPATPEQHGRHWPIS